MLRSIYPWLLPLAVCLLLVLSFGVAERLRRNTPAANFNRVRGPFLNIDVFGREGLDTRTLPRLLPDGNALLVADYRYIKENALWLQLWQLLGVDRPEARNLYEIRLLDVETGKHSAVFHQNADGFSDNVCVSPDGKTLAVWWSDGGQAVYLWDIPPKKPWLRILAWSAGPVAGLLLLVGLFKLWSRRGRDAAVRSPASSRGG